MLRYFYSTKLHAFRKSISAPFVFLSSLFQSQEYCENLTHCLSVSLYISNLPHSLYRYFVTYLCKAKNFQNIFVYHRLQARHRLQTVLAGSTDICSTYRCCDLRDQKLLHRCCLKLSLFLAKEARSITK